MRTVAKCPWHWDTECYCLHPNWVLVPCSSIGLLEEQFAKLAKRAAKLKSGIICLDVEPTIVMKTITRWSDATLTSRKVEIPCQRVNVTGTRPILLDANGNTWEFLATLVHEETGTVINRVPTAEVREGELNPYREAKADCDHCGFNRRRKHTYIVRSPEGDLKQVGRTCLKDYLGHDDPMTVAKVAELLVEGVKACAGYANLDGPNPFGVSEIVHSPITFVETVLGAIRCHGWLSRTKARETTGQATADVAWWHLFEVLNNVKRHFYVIDAKETDAKEAEELVIEALERLGAKGENRNDYEHNLWVALSSSVVREKTAGLVASAVGYVQRARKKEHEAKQANALLTGSTHQGVVGSQIDRVVTIDHVSYHESDFGPCTLVKFHDANGNAYLWWASGMKEEVEPGDRYWATMKVKRHETDRRGGWPVTVVNYVSLSEDVETFERSVAHECPHCLALPGEWCKGKNGKRTGKIHKKRTIDKE